MNPRTEYELWLEKLPDTEPMKKELQDISGNEDEIVDRFYQVISFGTAGLRGICGAGTNRMNELTVGRATAGIADFIETSGEDKMAGVAFAYDCRYHSQEFAYLAAEILCARGIKVYMYDSLRPTPELSFAIRRLGAIAGVNMTASHNPKEYNGYKVYWKDGAQISGEISAGMSAAIEKSDLFVRPERMSMEDAKAKGLLIMLGEEMDIAYLDYVKSMSLRGDETLDKSVSFVYTPLNGAGAIPVTQIFKDRAFTGFHILKEQEAPDPEFTTVGYPNPEDPKAFALSEKLGKEIGAEVLIATDPDSDRMAIEVADGKGGYRFLNGNQTGGLIIAYKAQSMAEKDHGLEDLNGKYAMIKSIVTGDFGRAVCEGYGIKVYEALTGFKNICGRIADVNRDGYEYFFGYEESIGVAPGEAVRDKDGVTAAMLIAEMAAWLKKQGKTISDYLDELYTKFGFFAESQYSMVLEGEPGKRKIEGIMKNFRENNPQSFGKYKVAQTIDYLHGYQDIPASNVLIFKLEGDSWFAMRPSGTEPKLKFYFYTKRASAADGEALIKDLQQTVLEAVG